MGKDNKMKNWKTFRTLLSGIMVLFFPVAAYSKPGPVTVKWTERFEFHSNVISVDPGAGVYGYEGASYLYNGVSAARSLDEHVGGEVFYINKYDIEDRSQTSDAVGLRIAQGLSDHWNAMYSFTHNFSVERDKSSYPKINANRATFDLNFKLNPNTTKKSRYSLSTVFSTGGDFGADPYLSLEDDGDFNIGRTLSEKIDMDVDLSKTITFNASYRIVFGLREDADPETRRFERTHYANLLDLNLRRKLKHNRIFTVGFMFMGNLYPGAVSNDTLLRIGMIQSIY